MREYVDIEKIKDEEYTKNVANIYYSGNWIAVIDENGRKKTMEKVRYSPTYQGMELELLFNSDLELEKIGKKAYGYHNGNRHEYGGGMHIFSVIERDGSLNGMGYEFITKKHVAMDKRFWFWFNKFGKLIKRHDVYIDDHCGGHIHISGWNDLDAPYVFGAFRAYVPMLIGRFGNGEHGIMRYNDYSSIAPIKRRNGYDRSNINYISDEHFELRFYDGEWQASEWFARELINDAIVYIAKSIRKEGIGRYVNPTCWYKQWWAIVENNEIIDECHERMVKEFLEDVERSDYPYYSLVERAMKRENVLEEYVKVKREPHIIIGGV